MARPQLAKWAKWHPLHRGCPFKACGTGHRLVLKP